MAFATLSGLLAHGGNGEQSAEYLSMAGGGGEYGVCALIIVGDSEQFSPYFFDNAE